MATQTLDNDLPDSQRSLYRMIIDFRQINSVTLNQKTSQLPSIQSMEVNFQNAYVSTIDLSNCYPSIVLKKSSRDFFNFYMEHNIWHHVRLAQGWSASLQIAQTAVLWTFRDSTLAEFMIFRHLTPEQFTFTSFRQFLQGFVDDLSIFSAKTLPNAVELHCLTIEAVFYALQKAGWLVN